jgi:hypothetical protein
VALLQRARNDARKKKRLAEKNLASNLTVSSSAIVSGLFPPPVRVNPSPASILSSSLSNFDEDTISPTVVIPSRPALPQNRSTFRSVSVTVLEKQPSAPKGFRYGSSVYFDQLMQETFGPYGSKYGLSSRYVTKIPVDLDILQELCDLRSTVGKPSDIATINHWIRLLAESIDLPPSKFGIRSFFDEPEEQQSSSSSAQVRSVIGDSYHEDATYVDSSSIYLHEEEVNDEDINVYHEDPPADYGPMVDEEQSV